MVLITFVVVDFFDSIEDNWLHNRYTCADFSKKSSDPNSCGKSQEDALLGCSGVVYNDNRIRRGSEINLILITLRG